MELQELKKMNIGYGIIDCSSLHLGKSNASFKELYLCLSCSLDSDYIAWQGEILDSGSTFWAVIKK